MSNHQETNVLKNVDKCETKGAQKSFQNMSILFNLGNESTSNQTILKLNDKFDKNGDKSCALIIPGVEGIAGSKLFSLAKNLTIQAYALQMNIMSKFQKINDLTDEVFKVTKQI